MTRYEINVQNKPEWFVSRVNPAAKVRFPEYFFVSL